MEGDVVVVGVLIKGMDYLFASQWHFACLPNSCCGLSVALAWLTAFTLAVFETHMVITQILLATDSLLHTSIFPRILFLSVSVSENTSEQVRR